MIWFMVIKKQKKTLINKLAKLGDAIVISNLKLSITDPFTHSLTRWVGG